MEEVAIILCGGVFIYGLAVHRNETIILASLLVVILGATSLFSLTRQPIESIEIVNEEGEEDEVEETKPQKKPIETTESTEIIEETPNEKLKAKATRYAKKFRIDAKLFHALIKQESRWRKSIRSPVGATGLGQVMPFNVPLCAKEKLSSFERIEWLKNPDNNLFCSAKILKSELVYWDRKYPSDRELAIKSALGSYNAGRNAVENKNALTAFRETRNYVKTIWENYKS